MNIQIRWVFLPKSYAGQGGDAGQAAVGESR